MVSGQRIEGTRLIGVVLIGIAALVAFQTFDGPGAVPAAVDASSASARPEVVPPVQRVTPKGTVSAANGPIAWSWDGPEPSPAFEVVLLDESFTEVHRIGAGVASELTGAAASGLRAQMTAGERYHWCVQVAGDPSRRSAPLPIRRR